MQNDNLPLHLNMPFLRWPEATQLLLEHLSHTFMETGRHKAVTLSARHNYLAWKEKKFYVMELKKTENKAG